MSRLVFLLTLILLAARPVLAQPAASCPEGQPDYQVALQSYQDGLFDPAIAGFTAFVQRCPHTPQAAHAHYLLAEMFYKRERFETALRHARAAAANPEVAAHAWLLAAQCALKLARFDEARQNLERLLATPAAAPLFSAAWYWLGEIALRQQRHAEAIASFQRALQQPAASPYKAYAAYALGWVYRERGDAAAALEAFDTFLAMAPTEALAPQARLARADLLRQLGRYGEAAAAFAQLARDGPASLQDEALFWWGEMAYRSGDYATAAQAYQRLVAAYPESPRVTASLYGLGWAHRQQQHCAEAKAAWEAFQKRQPASEHLPQLTYELGLCFLHQGDREAAQRLWQQLAAMPEPSPERQEALVKLAALAFQEKRYDEAIRYGQQALAAATGEVAWRLHFLLAEGYAAIGELAQARSHWQHVLASPPAFPLHAEALLRLAETALAAKAWEEAVAFLRRLWEGFPDFERRAVVAVRLAQAYTQLGRCEAALPFYDAALAAEPAAVPRQTLLLAKAHCLLASGRDEDLVRLLAPQLTPPALDIVPPEALLLLAQAYLRLQRPQDALTPLAALWQRFPQSPYAAEAAPLLATLLAQAGRNDEALAVWKAFLQRPQTQTAAAWWRWHLEAGHLAVTAGDLEAALNFFSPARRAAEAEAAAEATFWSGEVYLKQGQWELALQVYQELLDRFPAAARWRALARLRLGLLYERQQDWEQALQMYRALLHSTTDAELLATARQRIAAIEAGRVSGGPHPSPSEG